MNGTGTTASYTIPAGDYYLYYSATGIGSGFIGNLTLFNQTVPTSLVTNGSVKAFKTTNKVTVNQNGNFTWSIVFDD